MACQTFQRLIGWTVVAATLVSAVDVTISLSAPAGAPTLPPSLVSLSIEQDRWTQWAGNTSRNDFLFNVLNNIVGFTQNPPHIRIGADSEDHTNFNPNIPFSQAVFPPPTTTVPYPEATKIVAGDGFYEAAQFLPPKTHVTWGVNLGGDNLTAAFLESESIMKAFSSSVMKSANVQLDAIEIGNEADLYSNNGLRASSYNITQYVKEWTQFATNVSAAAQLSSTSSTKFWGGAFAGSSHTSTGFSPQGIFSNGILNSPAGSLISTISQHHYSGSFCSGNGGLLSDLMEKSTIRSNLSAFTPDIAATHSQGLDYILGETNSYSCHGAPGVSNTAGAALWALDYALFASQLGIHRVFFHEGVGYKYNLIQPVTLTNSILNGSALSSPLAPHVQPPYYAAIIAAETIGTSARAIELNINASTVAGYGFYTNVTGELTKALFINSQAYLTTTTTPRTSVHIDFTLTGSGATKTGFTVKRLNISHADDDHGLTWGGQSYETTDGKVSGTLVTEHSSIDAGIDIQETEVVLVTFV